MTNNPPTVLFLSHGGGPLPLLGDEGHEEMIEKLQYFASKIQKPSAILVISAHWEESIATITSGANPSIIYDYYGFPEESYSIQYPCSGEPALARQVADLLDQAEIVNRRDESRGLDHGVWVPLKIMYPNADIPCVQLSLIQGLDPAEHVRIGSVLANIQHENLLIIGSGFSFHNMKAFFAAETADERQKNKEFEQWLVETCSDPDMEETERMRRLNNWEEAPHARYCHPREEHLLPLHVCYGVTQSSCTKYAELNILNKKSSMYLWQSR